MFTLALLVAMVSAGEMPDDKTLQFELFNPPDCIDGRGLYEDIYSRTPNSYLPQLVGLGSRVVECHEATHFVNNRLRNESNKHRLSCYFGEGRVLAFERQPNIRLSDVADEVPSKFRDWLTYKNYLVSQQKYWDAEPLYLFDEWSAFRNGTRLGRIERIKLGGSEEFERQFHVFGDALVAAIRKGDPDYPELGKVEALTKWLKDQLNQEEAKLARESKYGVER